MQRYRSEYRINKNGCECFRTEYHDEAIRKLAELRKQKPRANFEIQTRTVSVNKYGVPRLDWKGRPAWSAWS